jgi:hypothetical protein
MPWWFLWVVFRVLGFFFLLFLFGFFGGCFCGLFFGVLLVSRGFCCVSSGLALVSPVYTSCVLRGSLHILSIIFLLA